jgi:hypothetical protein
MMIEYMFDYCSGVRRCKARQGEESRTDENE